MPGGVPCRRVRRVIKHFGLCRVRGAPWARIRGVWWPLLAVHSRDCETSAHPCRHVFVNENCVAGPKNRWSAVRKLEVGYWNPLGFDRILPPQFWLVNEATGKCLTVSSTTFSGELLGCPCSSACCSAVSAHSCASEL